MNKALADPAAGRNWEGLPELTHDMYPLGEPIHLVKE
jgi:hypothetical protein